MMRHTLLTLYRSLTRHRLYAALNVLGLAAGIAVFLVSMLVVRYERGFDRWLPHASETYRVDGTWSNPGQPVIENEGVSFVALKMLRADFPQIAGGAREMTRNTPVSVGQTIDSEPVSEVDPSFLKVVALPLLSGNPATALADPNSVVINQTIARKYFNTTNAVGRTLDILQDGVKHAYTVSAVMRDLPADTSLKFSMLVPLASRLEQGVRAFIEWGAISGNTFLRLPTKEDANALRAGLRDFIHRRASGTGVNQIGPNAENTLRLSLVALPDAHFHDVSVSEDPGGVDPRVVASLAAVGLMALLTAAINYINLATARAALRAREVALRKVVGATRAALLWQFLAEAVVVVALAALIGLSATELALPVVNALGGWAVRLDYGLVALWLVGVVVVVGLGAGLYPAVLLANYRPATVLASARAPAGGRMGTRLRNLLVLTQFAAAIGFAICTLMMNGQARLLRTADRGFDRNGLIIVRSLDVDALRSRQVALFNQLTAVPGVIAATRSDREPSSTSTTAQAIDLPGESGPPPSITVEEVGSDYLRAYGVHLVAGRWFDARHAKDDLAGNSTDGGDFNAVVNRAALPELGVRDPRDALGKTFRLDDGSGKALLRVIGVVQNVRFMSPREPVSGQLYLYDSKSIEGADAAIRYAGVPRAEMLARLQAKWRSLVSDEPFVASTADQRLEAYYRPDAQRARLFTAGAVLAVAIACIGLYGLASFSTARRIKEIGIRKVLGASTRDVLMLLVGQFVRPVLIANLIAWPIAFLVMRSWLSSFDQRISISPLYFLAAGGGAVFIAVLTVLGQAWHVARAEPARALRYE
jgi:putative ABC transport system permease protein